jgi:AcrR family transcriptional regulator
MRDMDETRSAEETTETDDGVSVKERIERCALELFAERGYANTSVREIVEAAGVTKPTMYYYFKNKEQLYETLFVEKIEAFFVEMRASLSKPVALREKLLSVANLYFSEMRIEPLLSAAIYRATFGSAPDDRILPCEQFTVDEVGMIREALQAAAEAGEIDERHASDFTAIQFIGAIEIYCSRQAIGVVDDLAPELAERIVDFFMNALR